MSPPFGGAAPLPTPRRPASTGGSGEAAAPPCLLKRKDPAGVEDEAAPARNVRSKSPPPSPPHEPQVQAGVSAPQHGASSGEEDTPDDASVAELGEKLLPRLPKGVSAATWARFVNNAEICLKHYNIKHQSNFVYKHAPGNGYCRVQEQDGSCYYHMNFDAQDKSGRSQLFFGEIKVGKVSEPLRRRPSMCYRIGTRWVWIKSIAMHAVQDLSTQKGPAIYVAGHFADVRQYYGFWEE